MDASFKIEGLDKLNKELKALPEDFRNKALQSTTRAATKLIQLEATELAPKKTGNLSQSIVTKKVRSHSKWVAMYKVTINRRGKKAKAHYAHMVENGTVKQPAQPFMRPAYERKQKEAVEHFKMILAKKIAFYQRKIARLRK